MRNLVVCLSAVLVGAVFGAFARGETPPDPVDEPHPYELPNPDREPAPPSANSPSHVGSAHQSFQPYDPGPAEALWSREQLSSEDRALADHNRDHAQAWAPVQDAYARAARARAQDAAALAAEHQLGLEDSGNVGVVP